MERKDEGPHSCTSVLWTLLWLLLGFTSSFPLSLQKPNADVNWTRVCPVGAV